MNLAAALHAAGAKRVLVPSDAGYAEQLTGFNLATTYTPEAVVEATRPTDVAAAIAVARDRGAPLTVLGTGHGVLRDVTAGVLVSMRNLAGVEIDPAARTARISGAAKWKDVLAAASPYGLAGLCGSAPGVGVIGYLLGGGLGPLGRGYGYAADHVRSIEIVTPADGPITVEADSHPDLFWALRGGKGGFGIVTAVTVDLFPIRSVIGGGLYFGADDAQAVLTAFSEWAPQLPESATPSVALLRLPPAPQLPEAIRGRFVAHVRFVSTDAPDRAEVALAPIRAVATPVLDTVGVLPFTSIGTVHGDPTEPMAAIDASVTLTEFGSAAVDALLGSAGPSVVSPLSAVEIRLLGGALARQAEIPNAVGARGAAYNLFTSGAVLGSGDAPIRRAVGDVLATVEAWRGPHCLANFVGRANTSETMKHAWDEAQNVRLDIVRATADPDGLFPFARHGRP